MADVREETGRLYGPPRITIVPHEGLEEGPPQLHASRVPSLARALRIIQPLETLYPSARSTENAPASTVWDSQRVQRRWLFNAHPEAFIGSSNAAGFLAEGLSQMMRPDATPTAQPLMTISQMADVSNHTRISPVPVVAMATGESGELLRLSRLDETKWQWGEDENPTLRLLNVDQQDREETVLWSSDGAPILQLKPALSLVRFEPTRWLLVQKRTSTTVLQPEYHRIPVSERRPGIDKAVERPSRINPKPILTITSEQTGGFPHSDVSFSYGSQRKPPQLAIIDECGYYSVWDVKGRDMVGSTSKRAKLRHCGQIQLGITEQLPDEDSPAFRAEPHGLLWIGAAGVGVDLWDIPAIEDLEMENDLAAMTARSKKLMIWNRTKFEVIDTKDPSYRHSLSILKSDVPDYILDVKPNPLNRSQVVVLTTSALFWIETSSPTAVKTGGLAILQSFAHLRISDADSLRLTVHHSGHGLGNESCIAYLYSEKSPEVELFWLSIPEKTGLPQFQHFMMMLEKGPGEKPLKIQTLCPTPAFFTSQSSEPLKGLGAEYLNQQVGFQQLFVLGRDLALEQTIMAVTSKPDLEIIPPDYSRDWSKDARRRAHKRRRKQFLHYFGDTFVVPDGLGDMDELVQRRATRYQEILQQTQGGDDEQLQQRWPRTQNFNLFLSRVAMSIDSVVMAAETPSIEGPLSVFDAIQDATVNCLDTEGGYIPLHTLHEYEATFEAPPMGNEAIAAWDARLREFFDVNDQRIVAQPFTSQLLRQGDATPLADIRHKLEELWNSPDLPERAQHSRSVVLAETAEAIARSVFGVAVLDENIPVAEDEPSTWVPTPPELQSRQPSQRLSMSSQRSSLGSQRLSMSPFKPRDSMSPIKASRPMLSPIKPRLSMSPLKPRRSMSPMKSPSKPSSSAPYSSNPFSSSQPQSQSSAASADAALAASSALQRLSMLAADINTTEGPTRQHTVLSYWPTRRGVPTENYVSSVLASSTKHMDAIKERKERIESKRRRRKSQLASSQTAAAATQSEMEDSGPAGSASVLLPSEAPATQPLPKFAAPPIIGSSQVSPMRSSQAVMSSQIPQVMSQPISGRHAMRSPKKKGKRKSGF
ncbi:hypothetical protein CGCF415_v005228 [Colletotrichum fructicola]|nr:hypothetical protein CGCF415_v005228 [Colletotrichum fructicola]KAF4939897.1 hypothetical protein CGCF245_v003153 [Colletotrichum fructicola]